MPSLRELRRKVKSVKSTQQITKAMKMVAAARLRRAQARILGARPFALRMQELLADVLLAVADTDGDRTLSVEELTHPLLRPRASGPRGLLLITADKGLCGAFNTNLIKKALEFMRENEGRPVAPPPGSEPQVPPIGGKPGGGVALFCVGRKGRDFFRRVRSDVRGEYVNIFNQLSYAQAELIGRDVTDFFLNQGARDVTIIYNEFKSVLQQKLVRATLLPLTPPELPARSTSVHETSEFIYEPSREALLESLLPRYLKSQIFRALLESYAAEMGARMTAMESATKNARELIEGLTLYANKIRQAAITKEISELVGGAEALQ